MQHCLPAAWELARGQGRGKGCARLAVEASTDLEAVLLQLHVVFCGGLAVRDGQRDCRGQERPKSMAHRPAAQSGGVQMCAKVSWTLDDTGATRNCWSAYESETACLRSCSGRCSMHAFAAAADAFCAPVQQQLPRAAVCGNATYGRPQQSKARQRDVLCRRSDGTCMTLPAGVPQLQSRHHAVRR